MFGIFFAIAGGLATVACTALNSPVSPTGSTGSVSISAKFSSSGSGSGAPVISGAPMSDFSTGSIVLTKGATTVTSPIVIANGRASATVAGLESGVWSITLNFYNATGNLTFTGTSSVTVNNGVTTSVSVIINAVSGSITFDFGLPMDGNDFIGNFTGPNSSSCSVYWENNNLRFFNGGGTSTGIAVNATTVTVADWAATGVLSPDLSTITWYDSNGNLYSGTGTPWVRQ